MGTYIEVSRVDKEYTDEVLRILGFCSRDGCLYENSKRVEEFDYLRYGKQLFG